MNRRCAEPSGSATAPYTYGAVVHYGRPWKPRYATPADAREAQATDSVRRARFRIPTGSRIGSGSACGTVSMAIGRVVKIRLSQEVTGDSTALGLRRQGSSTGPPRNGAASSPARPGRGGQRRRCTDTSATTRAGAQPSTVQDEPAARHPVGPGRHPLRSDIQGTPHPGTQATCGWDVAQ